MKVLLTGASGFLGGYINDQLKKDHRVITLGRNASNQLVHDISIPIDSRIQDSLDMVVHAAGKAHSVPLNEDQEREFYDINLEGTRNLLQFLVSTSIPSSFIFISTVAVYGLSSGALINEDSEALATDPYGKSKLLAELEIEEWGRKNNCKVVILRLPLITGKNPPGNLEKMIRALQKGYYFNLKKGKAKRSMVYAGDVGKLIPQLYSREGTYNLTDGIEHTFREISDCLSKTYSTGNPRNLPGWLASLLATAGSVLESATGKSMPFSKKTVEKMTIDLTFDCTKAKSELHWNPENALKYIEA